MLLCGPLSAAVGWGLGWAGPGSARTASSSAQRVGLAGASGAGRPAARRARHLICRGLGVAQTTLGAQSAAGQLPRSAPKRPAAGSRAWLCSWAGTGEGSREARACAGRLSASGRAGQWEGRTGCCRWRQERQGALQCQSGGEKRHLQRACGGQLRGSFGQLQQRLHGHTGFIPGRQGPARAGARLSRSSPSQAAAGQPAGGHVSLQMGGS